MKITERQYTIVHLVSLLVPLIAIFYASIRFFEIDRIPYPYDDVGISPIPAHYMNIYNYEKFSTVKAIELFAVANSIPITRLDDKVVRKLFVGNIHGAESVGIIETNSSFKLLMLDKYGNIRVAERQSPVNDYVLQSKSLYIGPGRPLGFHIHPHLHDTLFVCDSLKGLLAVDLSDGDTVGERVQLLTNAYSPQGQSTTHLDAINYLNDLDVTQDGHIVYFSSSTARGVVAYDSRDRYYDTMRSFLLTWLAGDISGRVFAYDMTSKATEFIADDFYYANGVALTADGSSLFVVETLGLRVWKVHLVGNKRGEKEVFLDHLPGMPDGVTRSRDGKSILISLVAPLSPILPMGRSAFSRWLIAWALLSPFKVFFERLIKKCGCVIRVAADTARVEAIYLDSDGSLLSTISSVTEDSSGRLFFGNLGGNFVSYFEQ